jgi:hypothetical protein
MALTISDSLRARAGKIRAASFHFVGKTMLIRHGAESRVHDWCLPLFLRAGKGWPRHAQSLLPIEIEF